MSFFPESCRPSLHQSPEVMSQKSDGEAGPLPSALLASDAMSTSLTKEGPRSAFSTSTSTSMHSSTLPSDQNPFDNRNVDPEDIRSSRVVPEMAGADGGNGKSSNSGNGKGSGEVGGGRVATSLDSQLHHQLTPSKRHTILNISPPPHDLFDDSHMSCQDPAPQDLEQSNSIWMEDSVSNFSNMSTSSYNDNTEVPRKSRKRTPRQRPGPKSVSSAKTNMDVFDADSAKGPHFVLSQLGPDSKAGMKGSSDDTKTTNQKRGTLSMHFPPKCEGKELKILIQPETQHRARYLTEGSRGSVKDRTQQGFPTIKLEGVNEHVVLQVFVGNDAGRVKPHGFYQACRVTGRNTTACKEVNIDGTTVIEVPLEPSTNMTLSVDCVGILKLRNADVEARIGVAGSKKKSTRARLVFRVNIPRSDGSVLTLQTPSSPILCNTHAVKKDVPVKQEVPSPVKNCTFDDIKVVDSALMPSMLPLVKREEITPMEVTSNLQSSGVFEQNGGLCSAQENSDLTSANLNEDLVFNNILSQPAGDADEAQVPTFANAEPLTTIQKQDIAVSSSYSLPSESLLPQGPQQFLLEPREGLMRERSGSNSARLCAEPAPQEQQMPLFPPDEVAQLEEAVRQLKAKGLCGLTLQSDNSITKQQQQQHIQHQQQIQNQQIQQHSVLENLQLFQSQIQMQCGMFQDASQAKSSEHQSSPQGVVTNQASLFPSEQPSPQNQQQQQAALFQQANDLCSMQTGFLQQTPTPAPMFHNPSPLSETQNPQGALFQKATQEQVQAAIFQNTMTVLQSPEQQPSNPGLYLPPASLPTQLSGGNSQQQQQQQLAFLNALQSSSPEPQSVFQTDCGAANVSNLQMGAQMSPIQQGSPMEQQQPLQPPPQPAQQTSLFQTMSPHSSPNTLPPGQQQQPGLMFCTNSLSTPPQASNLLFPSQGQMPPMTSSSLVSQESQNPSLLFSQASMVTVDQQNRPEPMALGNPADPQQQVMFQEQQPMMLVSGANNGQEESVGLFIPQSNMASLQGELAAQELAQSAMFASQNSVANLQTTTTSPVQQPRSLFQHTVNGNISQPSQPRQPGLFLFGIQNECGQMMNAPGNTVSDQIIAISQSDQRESEARIQTLLNQSMNQTGTVQSNMSAPQNMDKMDDLLVSFQESGSNLTRSY
ncbi:nuclear factor of activated T-cells 5 isoform X5 [Nothobranchius furzeri]|uniref:nuclear factor of activated T-cells 5 isoform X5 n=1 Tax=Nothobranchius furzeri TaxID=105023 RepID=UPI003904A721